jgi:putative oxidoreductase
MIDDLAARYAALVLRLTLAGFFMAHLFRKFAVIGFDPWWSGLEKSGYQGWMLAYTVAAEFAGAVLILLGVYTRAVCLLTLPVLIAVTNHWAVRKGFWFADGGAEFPLAWCAMLVVQILLGDGAYALALPTPAWWRAGRRAATAAGD